jgi:hypothetical protein
MGTRCLTKFFDEGDSKPFAVLYRQMDGYPDGHGRELATFLAARQWINGIGGETSATAANGIGCLAAQVVGAFKDGRIGGFYLVTDGAPSSHGEDYVYEVRPAERARWRLSVYGVHAVPKTMRQRRPSYYQKLLWEGPPEEFPPDTIIEEET